MIAPLSWRDDCLHVLTRFQTGTNVVKINTHSSLWKLAKQQMLLLEIAGTSASLDEKTFCEKKKKDLLHALTHRLKRVYVIV